MNIPETIRLVTVLKQFFKPRQYGCIVSEGDLDVEKLKPFIEHGVENINVHMEVHARPDRFYGVIANDTILESTRNRVVADHPKFIITLKHEFLDMQLLSPEELEEIKTKYGGVSTGNERFQGNRGRGGGGRGFHRGGGRGGGNGGGNHQNNFRGVSIQLDPDCVSKILFFRKDLTEVKEVMMVDSSEAEEATSTAGTGEVDTKIGTSNQSTVSIRLNRLQDRLVFRWSTIPRPFTWHCCYHLLLPFCFTSFSFWPFVHPCYFLITFYSSSNPWNCKISCCQVHLAAFWFAC